jgi:hypothetical protein
MDRPASEVAASTWRKDPRLSKAVNAYWKSEYPPSDEEELKSRGPLTVAEVEAELVELYDWATEGAEEIYGSVDEFEDSDWGRRWARLKAKCEPGDGFYRFLASNTRYPEVLTEGYVLVRDGKVVQELVTSIN